VGERETLMHNGLRFSAIGRLDRLPKSVRRHIDETVRMTARNPKTNLCLCLSYGGRAEIADAARAIALKAARGEIDPASVDEAMVAAHMYQPQMPEPDLLIRTAGEMRVSNFLLWQISYAEFYVTDTLWPDFRAEHLAAAIADFGRRERRFGGLAAKVAG
jgi:undecaprenyl diphosphate synthase